MLPKKQRLLDIIRENNIHVFALCETWLQSSDSFHIQGFEVIRRDRPIRQCGGVLLGVRKDIGFRQTPFAQVNSCEMIAAALETTSVQGDCLNIAAAYCPPDCRLNSVEISAALTEIGSPILIFGDFNAKSQAWGCAENNSRASVMQTIIDDLALVFLNDGSLTRIASPPFRSSAVDLTLCSAGLSLDCTWRVLEDPGGSDHLPIVTSLSSISVPILSDIPAPIFDLTRHLDWHQFSDRILEAIFEAPNFSVLEEKYAFFVNSIRSAAMAAQTKTPRSGFHFPLAPAIWWDDECQKLKEINLAAFREFRNRANNENYENYSKTEKEFQKICRLKKTESWRLYCSTLNYQTRLSDVWRMAKRFRNPRSSSGGRATCGVWMDNFVNKISPPFVPINYPIREEASERFSWIARKIDMNEFEAALDICNNKAPGEDGIKFSLLKNLPKIAKDFLLDIFNVILSSGEVPESWHKTKVIPILKPGKNADSADSYRPISLLSCNRKLFEKIILTRLEYWAEKYEMLSPTQFGFRKGHGTRDCLAVLSTDIQTSFEQKQQTLVGFVDISGAYDNVLIDILCEQFFQAQLPSEIVRVMWNLLWRKELIFYIDGQMIQSSIGYKGLPQGSSLSPFSYSFYTSEVDLSIPRDCSLIQYADDLAVYYSHKDAKVAQIKIQSACNQLNSFFEKIGLSVSEKKSEIVLFSRKHTNEDIQILMNGSRMPVSETFRYLGVVFDRKLLWNSHVKYIQEKCLKRINLLSCMAGVSWGSHPDIMVILYKGLIRSILEYGCIVFDRMADTHMLKLERIQYRCLRIALGLMQSTHVQTLEIIAGVEPLRLRYSMLNQRYLISAYSKGFSRLTQNLSTLDSLRSPKIIREFSSVSALNILPNMSNYNRPLDALLYSPNSETEIRKELSEIPRENFHLVAPRIVSRIAAKYDLETVIFTDGSRWDGRTGFGVYHGENFEVGYRLQEPSGVFTAELTAIFYALEHIRTHQPGQYLILTDSMSSVCALQSRVISPKRHSMIYDIKEALWRLGEDNYKINIGWIPSHVGIGGNERVDQIAKTAAAGDNFSLSPVQNADFIPQAKSYMIREWQEKWNSGDMGRFCFSIFPTVSLKPWFLKFKAERHVITKINRMISNHTCLQTHLNRIGIVENPICECGEDYDTLDHILWTCERFSEERVQLINDLSCANTPTFVPIRDLLGGRFWNGLRACCAFLKKCGLQI